MFLPALPVSGRTCYQQKRAVVCFSLLELACNLPPKHCHPFQQLPVPMWSVAPRRLSWGRKVVVEERSKKVDMHLWILFLDSCFRKIRSWWHWSEGTLLITRYLLKSMTECSGPFTFSLKWKGYQVYALKQNCTLQASSSRATLWDLAGEDVEASKQKTKQRERGKKNFNFTT